MSPAHIAWLSPIIGTIYNPDGSIRSFLTINNNCYQLYCKDVGAYNVYITKDQMEEILQLLQSPITEPNKEELLKY